MKSNKEIYERLSKELTDEELVEGIIYSERLDDEHQRLVEEEFAELRKEMLRNMSPERRLLGLVLQMKYAQRAYFKKGEYLPEYSFANQLRHYIDIGGRSQTEVANDLDVERSKLIKILKGQAQPDVELMYRLEKHSSGELPAHHWWRLYAMELEHIIRTDLQKKIDEGKKVSNVLKLSA